jgi:hypothetical protein
MKVPLPAQSGPVHLRTPSQCATAASDTPHVAVSVTLNIQQLFYNGHSHTVLTQVLQTTEASSRVLHHVVRSSLLSYCTAAKAMSRNF